MKLGYSLRPKADKDIADIADDFVERVNIEAGLSFLAISFATFALIVTQPEMGWLCRLRHPELKAARVFRIGEPFEKYLIFYLPLSGRIEILRILHGAQDLENIFWEDGVL